MKKLTLNGKYKVKNPEKYDGDTDKVIYRSSWERAAFLWCDKNSNVVRWNSEEVIVPYLYSIDGKFHRYFVDLFIEFKGGEIVLVEIKPSKETKKPKKRKNKSNGKYLAEAKTYVKNQNKWAAAKKFAEARGWKFQVWDEIFLKRARILKW